MAARALHIVILDSWHVGSADGSGTAVGIRGLAMGLSGLGHHVEIVRPNARDTSIDARISFNLDLDRRLAEIPVVDLVVGVDIDGFAWIGQVEKKAGRDARLSSRPPYVVCLKGVAADEAQSEEGPARLQMESLARLERLNAERADRVIVPSRYSAEVAARLYGLPHARIAVVPEPVDLSRWPQFETQGHPVGPLDRTGRGPRARPGAGSTPGEGSSPGVGTILSVARQYPRKDTATLLRATALLLGDCPGARVRVVGDGPTLEDSRALARSLGIDDAVTFLGALPDDEDVANEYLAADVFCLPSRQEGFGIVFVEAMAAGLPIVAARAGAVPEVVPAGEAGTLVPPGDAGALATALRTLLRDPYLRDRMGRAGWERARRYDVANVARSFIDSVSPLLT